MPWRNVLDSISALEPALHRILADLPAERRANAPLRELYSRQHTPGGLAEDARHFLAAHAAGGKAPYKELYRADRPHPR